MGEQRDLCEWGRPGPDQGKAIAAPHKRLIQALCRVFTRRWTGTGFTSPAGNVALHPAMNGMESVQWTSVEPSVLYLDVLSLLCLFTCLSISLSLSLSLSL